ncbi:integral membrane sensor signal transduction histidine kinase [Allomeiothermus silvanus DSM 9946]|uniref:histidine kinase n=1 Tax=Allomeiothermus silvanus (strain ATCC 700542 / DSM 9946 / NBRC 106475 / NCIMB 13440 / VI-R2) TaxID=526227 RepID=D7BBT5_ALLS1|nr:HAMP domain-containing sensor histidine kinase [Allomeiothermus silvanus]ADH62731.1 integral membrane sensor signal transduction histidine kinase [Allomeiothermus silvanus DSM 9946]
MTLRIRLALIAFGLTLLGLGLGLSITYEVLERSRLADLDQELKLQAELILQKGLANPKNQIPSEIENELLQESGLSSAQLYRGQQKIWEGGAVQLDQPLDASQLGRSGISEAQGWRVYTLSQQNLTVQVGQPLLPLRETLTRYVEVAVPLVLLLALFSGGLAFAAVGLAVRPLERLTQAAKGFESGSEVPAIQGKDEAATLAKAFAGLLDDLKTQREREQRFLAYAAHELRTPLSAFRASLEAARIKGQLEAEQLSRLHREALRLETLAQNLLALSRAEAGEVRGQPLDLADLVSEAFDRFQPLALERKLELDLEAGPAPTYADPRLLEQALNNLVANALRYTASGKVTLRSGQEDGQAYLEVADTGPGFSANASEGLGLRVVRAVVAAHHGRADFSSGQGSRVRLWLRSFRF